MASIFGFAAAKVTVPGPRYFERVNSTGGGALRISLFAPLVYCASSSAHRLSASGTPTTAFIDFAVLAGWAIGPTMPGPAVAKRRTGGRLYPPLGPCSDALVGVML